jgi:hypothetical protein
MKRTPAEDERSEPTGGGELPWNVKVLGAASLLNDVASEMVFPLLPQFLLSVLGGNRFHLGIIEGVADSVSSLLKLWSGAWSDRAGQRKSFVVAGYLLAAFARPFIGLASAPWHVFAARSMDRIGKGIRTSPRDALIADSSDAAIRGRAFGFHQAMDHLGAAVGPILATLFLLAWPGELRWLFLLTLIPGVAVAGLVTLGLREIPVTRGAQEGPQLTLKSIGGNFRLFLLALFLFTLGNSSDDFCWCGPASWGFQRRRCRFCGVCFTWLKAAGTSWPGDSWTGLGRGR